MNNLDSVGYIRFLEILKTQYTKGDITLSEGIELFKKEFPNANIDIEKIFPPTSVKVKTKVKAENLINYSDYPSEEPSDDVDDEASGSEYSDFDSDSDSDPEYIDPDSFNSE